MTCLRCDGLMVHEEFEDLDGITSSQRNTLFYRTLADEAHPFNPIQEEAPCEDLIDTLSSSLPFP